MDVKGLAAVVTGGGSGLGAASAHALAAAGAKVAVLDLNGDDLNDLVMLDTEGYLAFFERRRAGDEDHE